ncbi:hypothetical protein FJT64_001639 [Amphibalanus amphitrite]|uniref:Uncharacterized protein n=1 Tax=Amphibalanus amphitrite TaxID=1232801 RepID=A0A6A4X4M9_AMPAM|nr:hypothetical protein FJT64_001639 [Amphibalanus amphitrite]
MVKRAADPTELLIIRERMPPSVSLKTDPMTSLSPPPREYTESARVRHGSPYTGRDHASLTGSVFGPLRWR